MRKKLIAIIMLIGLLGFAGGIGTYAWFTDESTSSGNVFETGELIIGVPAEGDNAGFINASSLVPGEHVDGNVNVINLGDVAFKYKMSVIKTSGSQELFDKLNLVINDGTGDLYNGLLKDLNDEIGTLQPSANQTLNAVVSLPEDAGNAYQGTQAIAKFVFNATQASNNTWSE